MGRQWDNPKKYNILKMADIFYADLLKFKSMKNLLHFEAKSP